ncbi:MAG: ABC transporter substrate-binding protein [Planctomycetaceae bacterium]
MFTSTTLSAALAARLNPQDPQYNERLASIVAGVSAPSPFEFTVRFQRPPLRPEALFDLSLPQVGDSAIDGDDRNSPGNSEGIRFRRLECQDQTCRYVRFLPEPDTVKQKHVAEVREQKFESWDQLLQALQRGEISAVPYVNPVDLPSLKDDPRFFVLPYAQPVSHLIQIHPRSKSLQNGQLRRALLHGIHREKILTDVYLARVSPGLGITRLTASPFTMASDAYDRLLAQPAHDLVLAAALAATSRREFGGNLPTLKIARPSEVEIVRVVDAMIQEWKRIGIEVAVAESADEPWDLAYRTMQFHEPLVELWPFLLVDPAATMAGLEAFPERLRRQLLEIERATDWATANGLLRRLQTDLLIDARWIPLWEVDEFLLVRKNITGLPERLVHPYQGIERWFVQSWFPSETP